MSRNDIRPYAGSGGMHSLKAYPLAASTTILTGEPVVVSGGSIQEAATDPSVVDGICAVPTARRTKEGMTISALPTGTMIQVYNTALGDSFVCSNFATDGAGTPATPTAANAVGVQGGLTLDGNGDWWVDTGAANKILEIENVLTADGREIGDPSTSGLAGTNVVFRFI